VTVAGGDPAPAKYFLIMIVLNKLKPEDKTMVEKLNTDLTWTDTKKEFSVSLHQLITYVKLENIDGYLILEMRF
jgi:hypothetical protein